MKTLRINDISTTGSNEELLHFAAALEVEPGQVTERDGHMPGYLDVWQEVGSSKVIVTHNVPLSQWTCDDAHGHEQEVQLTREGAAIMAAMIRDSLGVQA